VSYPGFYATASLPGAHPALKAVSPQAPVTDEFIGDDARHNGAFFLLDNFDFINYFDVPRPQPVADYKQLFDLKITDAYQFFLKLGPIKNANAPQYFNNRARIWNEYLQHDTYDAYWQARNIRKHLTDVRPAVLTVGGWYDAEDLFGALHTYEAIEKQNPKATNRLTLETPFFNYYLKGKGTFGAAEATIFDTGLNQWKDYATWPPKAESRSLYLQQNGFLASGKEAETLNALRISAPHITRQPGTEGLLPFDEYSSDPA
nr:hypothetical protein [Tanacetum cinerariifolium]